MGLKELQSHRESLDVLKHCPSSLHEGDNPLSIVNFYDGPGADKKQAYCKNCTSKRIGIDRKLREHFGLAPQHDDFWLRHEAKRRAEARTEAMLEHEREINEPDPFPKESGFGLLVTRTRWHAQAKKKVYRNGVEKLNGK